MSKELYHINKQPPAWALKEITGGRLKGKTDINPQWRYETLNDTFGLIGFGWKYVITKQWLEKGHGDEVVAFVNIHLHVKLNNEWSEAIEGTGGSMFIANERNGAYTSDEAFKMATTDALSVACKMLGIAAAIYSGSKYPTEPKKDSTPLLETEVKAIDKSMKAESAKKALNKWIAENDISVELLKLWAIDEKIQLTEENCSFIMSDTGKLKDLKVFAASEQAKEIK
jgi:hypothetical protein